MKDDTNVSVKHQNVTINITSDGVNALNVDDMCALFEDALYGCGYRLKGPVSVTDEE